jgi:hypothetical protein
MNAKEKNTQGTDPDLQLAFDVGHSSIGWAAFQNCEPANGSAKFNLLGCGVVTFPNDDCLASKRRVFRSMRRHARSTRRRIERIAKVLRHVIADAESSDAPELMKELQHYADDGFQARAQMQGKGHAAPWLLAARVLGAKAQEQRQKAQLTWPELWHVLRWYAHNRGYDHETWGALPDDVLSETERDEKRKDTEKVQRAQQLMKDLGTSTMAETTFTYLFKRFGADHPEKVEKLPFFKDYFKGENCAFPRPTVRDELRRILDAHRALFEADGLDADAFVRSLLDDWREADRIKPGVVICGKRGDKEKLWLPRRFGKAGSDGSLCNAGLLFGRLNARFFNRIIPRCPVTGEKVPNKHCLEFLEFRWAEQVAKIQIEAPIPSGEEAQFPEYRAGELRNLAASERRKLDALARAKGFLRYETPKPDKKTGQLKGGVNDLGEILMKATACKRSNLENILVVPHIEEALRILPVKGDADAKAAFRATWNCFDPPKHDEKENYRDDPVRHRFTVQLLRGKELCVAEIIAQLQKLGRSELISKIQGAVRSQASDRKGRINEEKVATLLEAKFTCETIKGRAPFTRTKLVEAVQQIFHPTKPTHPLQKGGCLEQTTDIKRASLERRLDQLSNNHLVRHRLLILERLFKEIVGEFGSGDSSRVERIILEVARDLQTMSGLTSKEKARELGTKHAHFDKVSAKVAEALAEENAIRVTAGQKPLPVSYNLIRKCRIADDLGGSPGAKSWPCPYSLRTFTVADLVHRRYDKDHIIPRSNRLSDALEALVITSCEINAEKGQRTALQFIKEMSRPENDQKRMRLGIRTEAEFRAFVEGLLPKTDPFAAARAGRKVTDDDKRRWRRKQFLLTEKWEEEDFVPGDLTKSSHIIKLARQRFEAQFKDIPSEQRPVILNIPGAVTAAFRDRTWKLISELATIHPEVKKAHEVAEKARENGRDFNLKKTIRAITRLHHAVDAVALGIIAEYLVPHGDAGRAGLNDTFARLIIKAKLNAQERSNFEALRHELRLPKFYRWATGKCEDPNTPMASFRETGKLCIDALPPTLTAQIRSRLDERRVAQHVPSDMSGLGRRLTQNTSGILAARDRDGNLLWKQGRDTDEELHALSSRDDIELELSAPIENEEGDAEGTKKAKPVKPVFKQANQVLGFAPVRGAGKLTPMRGVRILRDNYGLAILDHAATAEEKFVIVPQHKVWHRLFDQSDGLMARNKGKPPRVIRNGILIRLKNTKPDGRRDGIWMVRSVKATLKLDLTCVDAPDVKDSGYGMWREVSVATLGAENIEILPKRLLGVSRTAMSSCPITSST